MRFSESKRIEGTISAIYDKFTYRKLQIMSNWEKLFPDECFVRQYEFKKKEDGSIDVDDFIKSLQRMQAPERAYYQYLKNQPLTIGTFSKLSQTSLIESVVHLAHEDDISVLCCLGNNDELVAAKNCFSSSKTFVVDASALVTLWLTGAFEEIKSFPFEGLVTEGAISLFREALQNKHARLWSRCLVNAENGHLNFDHQSAESIASQKERMKRFIEWVENIFQQQGGRAKLDVPADLRNKIDETVGEAASEAIGLAKQCSAPIWTDDLAVVALCHEISVTKRIWSDLVFEDLKDNGKLDSSVSTSLQLLLLTAGYQYTRVDPSIVELAIEQSHWKPNIRPLSSVVSWFHRSDVNELGALQISAFAIAHALEHAPLAHQFQAVTTEILRSIGKRQDGMKLLQILRQNANKIFGMNEFAKEDFLSVIHGELVVLSRGRRIILPGDPDYGI